MQQSVRVRTATSARFPDRLRGGGADGGPTGAALAGEAGGGGGGGEASSDGARRRFAAELRLVSTIPPGPPAAGGGRVGGVSLRGPGSAARGGRRRWGGWSVISRRDGSEMPGVWVLVGMTSRARGSLSFASCFPLRAGRQAGKEGRWRAGRALIYI
jgi:hypothetical protein